MSEMDLPNIPKAPATDAKKLPGVGGSSEEVFEVDGREVELRDSDDFEPLPEGEYLAKIVKFDQTVSSQDNPQYMWRFRIIDGEYKNREISFWTSLLPSARWKVTETLEAIGISAAGKIARFKMSDVIGKKCIIVVFHDDYKGDVNDKVKRVKAPTADPNELP